MSPLPEGFFSLDAPPPEVEGHEAKPASPLAKPVQRPSPPALRDTLEPHWAPTSAQCTAADVWRWWKDATGGAVLQLSPTGQTVLRGAPQGSLGVVLPAGAVRPTWVGSTSAPAPSPIPPEKIGSLGSCLSGSASWRTPANLLSDPPRDRSAPFSTNPRIWMPAYLQLPRP